MQNWGQLWYAARRSFLLGFSGVFGLWYMDGAWSSDVVAVFAC